MFTTTLQIFLQEFVSVGSQGDQCFHICATTKDFIPSLSYASLPDVNRWVTGLTADNAVLMTHMIVLHQLYCCSMYSL